MTVGDLVNFSVTATDSVSGVPGPFSWIFGDNTGTTTGATPSHTYTQAGTYQVTVSAADGAGNIGTGHLTIAVKPPGSTGSAPANTGTPTITGTAREGQALIGGQRFVVRQPNLVRLSVAALRRSRRQLHEHHRRNVGRLPRRARRRQSHPSRRGHGHERLRFHTATSAPTATVAAPPAGLPANTGSAGDQRHADGRRKAVDDERHVDR